MFYVYFSRTLLTSAADRGAPESICVALTQCLLAQLDPTISQNCSSVVDLNSFQIVSKPGDSMQLQHVRVQIDAKLDFQIADAQSTRACMGAQLRSRRFFATEMFSAVDKMYADDMNTDIVWYFAICAALLTLAACIDKWDKVIKREQKLLDSAKSKPASLTSLTPLRSPPPVPSLPVVAPIAPDPDAEETPLVPPVTAP